jgi:hypothetical protein
MAKRQFGIMALDNLMRILNKKHTVLSLLLIGVPLGAVLTWHPFGIHANFCPS